MYLLYHILTLVSTCSSFLMQGASPLASPGLNPGGAGAGGAILHRVGGLPRRCRIALPSLSPMGGSGGFGRRIYQPYHKVFPLSPRPPSRREGGDFWFISPGATAPGTPAPEPERHWDRGSVSRADRGRGHGGGGLPWGGANGGLHQQFIREKFLGVWGFFQEAPERFPAMVPGGKSLSRGRRERRTAPAIHSGKVLGGLGASFKKPPTFLRFFVFSL